MRFYLPIYHPDIHSLCGLMLRGYIQLVAASRFFTPTIYLSGLWCMHVVGAITHLTRRFYCSPHAPFMPTGLRGGYQKDAENSVEY